MKLAFVLVVMTLIAVPCCGSVCPKGCTYTEEYHHQFWRRVSDSLMHHAVAPWTIRINRNITRLPHVIREAECSTCMHDDMVAKPIYFEMSVYNKIQNSTSGEAYCRCPYQVAVGCTCVSKRFVGSRR